MTFFPTLRPFIVYLNKTSNLCRSYYFDDEQKKKPSAQQPNKEKVISEKLMQYINLCTLARFSITVEIAAIWRVCFLPRNHLLRSHIYFCKRKMPLGWNSEQKKIVEIVYLLLNVWFIALKRRNRNSVLYMENTFVQSV